MNSITIESRRKKPTTIESLHPGAMIVDVTSKGSEPWVRFSPFFPHGDIPIPFAQTVEGLWQGLKVFEREEIDPAKWAITRMSGIKRSGKSRGAALGHRFGIGSDVLLSYHDARHQIYLPAYKWVLENRLKEQVQRLREILASQPLVLLDYETNGDVENLTSPLSHAALVKYFLEGKWPLSQATIFRSSQSNAC